MPLLTRSPLLDKPALLWYTKIGNVYKEVNKKAV